MALPPEFQDTYRQYWALVDHAASAIAEDGGYAYTSSDLLVAASQLAREAGTPLSFQASSQLTSLFSLARANARASDTLTTANASSVLNTGMVGSWPTAASPDIQGAQPSYMARAAFTYTNAIGEQSTGWITLTNMTQLPPTVGNLNLRLQGAAQSAYSRTPEEGGTPRTDAEVMTEFGDFTSIQLFAV